MEVQGMVHALETIRRLLKPGGFIIDIHPIREEPLIKVSQEGNILFAESDPGYNSDEGLRHTEVALKEIVRRGLYLIEGKNEFEMVTYASSAPELKEYWAKYGAFDDSPKDEALTARKTYLYAKANEIMLNASGAEITYHERARITRLKPIAT